jgi:hypothetical protein
MCGAAVDAAKRLRGPEHVFCTASCMRKFEKQCKSGLEYKRLVAQYRAKIDDTFGLPDKVRHGAIVRPASQRYDYYLKSKRTEVVWDQEKMMWKPRKPEQPILAMPTQWTRHFEILEVTRKSNQLLLPPLVGRNGELPIR